ncbi:MAG: DUF115 domain-containing protein, partial [Spirochaetaceae bacterium]|nr:DUF115 domain-containing protein [Spirochaetaceae bacterium]
KETENAVLISVSSAAFALFQNGIKPDIIVTSDGGGWALNHLQECLRYDLGKTIIAAALNSALPSQYSNLHILPVADTSEYQNIILQNVSADFLRFPQRGTVSAFAMDLASCICGGKILLCGMDLADNDIESHTAPYAFDLLLEKTACRLKPVYSEQFKRAFAVKEAGTYDIYSNWFFNNIKKYKERIYSIGNIHSAFNIPRYNININDNDNIAQDKTCITKTAEQFSFELLKCKEKNTSVLIDTVLNELKKNSSRMLKELSALLSAGGKNSSAELEQAILKETILKETEKYRKIYL